MLHSVFGMWLFSPVAFMEPLKKTFYRTFG